MLARQRPEKGDADVATVHSEWQGGDRSLPASQADVRPSAEAIRPRYRYGREVSRPRALQLGSCRRRRFVLAARHRSTFISSVIGSRLPAEHSCQLITALRCALQPKGHPRISQAAGETRLFALDSTSCRRALL